MTRSCEICRSLYKVLHLQEHCQEKSASRTGASRWRKPSWSGCGKLPGKGKTFPRNSSRLHTHTHTHARTHTHTHTHTRTHTHTHTHKYTHTHTHTHIQTHTHIHTHTVAPLCKATQRDLALLSNLFELRCL